MQIHDLSLQNSLLNTFISEIRDIKIQKDSMRFRRNIERIGEINAFGKATQDSFSVYIKNMEK